MDLSGLKWPLIIIVIALVVWLMSSGGVNFMVKNFTKDVVGDNAKKDISDEAGLSRVGGYLLFLHRWEKAAYVFDQAITRYGDTGKNYWYNYYRSSTCYNRMKNYQMSYDMLMYLWENNANDNYDSRLPGNDKLKLAADKLLEMYDLTPHPSVRR
jgi:hypothetical protein